MLTDHTAEITDAPPKAGRSWPAALLVTALIGVGIYERSGLVAVAVIFAVVVPFEKLFPRHRQKIRRPGLGTDLAYAVAQPALRLGATIVGAVIAIASLMWIPGLLLRPAVDLMPFPVRAVVGFVLFDLATYWGHRWSHEVPFLWRFHVIHHSSPRLDWISGIRSHPFDGLVIGPILAFFVGAGFGVKVTGVVAVAEIVVGIFLHANVRWRLRPLHRLVATPEFHHWHHANEPDALNKNYSGLLPVWDVLFGSYFMPAERRPGVYGTDTWVPPTLAEQLRMPVRCERGWRRVVSHPGLEARFVVAGVRRGLTQIRSSTLTGRLTPKR